MTKITILKPKTAKPDELTIDTVVKLESGLHRLSKHIYSKKNGKNELYVIPTMRLKGTQPLKTSYHGSGQTHGKLAIGKLKQANFKFDAGKTELLGIDTLGEATPDSDILLWQKQETALNSIKGVVEINPTQQGILQMTNIGIVAATYPIVKKVRADYVFEIDGRSTQWIDMRGFFVEPDHENALEERIKELVDSYNAKSKSSLLVNKFKNVRKDVFFTNLRLWPASVENAVLFTNLSPWLAIVLFKFDEKAESLESFQNG